MSQALGRPVHLDHVALHLLPFPAFTINNLVIDELPPFGDEPIIRANTVSARLRLSSLWRRRVEFSRITFTDPSINLVRNPDGRWNLESFLLQAAHINAAPTAAPRAGSTPRFPYIEATGARINLKLAQHKTPFSLTEVELALWLPEPQQWKLRLRGRPARTDTGATDTGLLQTEATLERAGSVGQVPLLLNASWVGAPLGEASRVLTGTDAGIRGELSLTAHLAGTLDNAALQLELNLNGLHRADLIPDRLVDIDLQCRAGATHLLHTLNDLHCGLAPSRRHPHRAPPPHRHPRSAHPFGKRPQPPRPRLRPARPHRRAHPRRHPPHLGPRHHRPPRPRLQATGELNGTATWPGAAVPAIAQLDLTHLALSGALLGANPITFAPVTLTGNAPNPGTLQGATLELAPTPISFGRPANQHPPAATTLDPPPPPASPLPTPPRPAPTPPTSRTPPQPRVQPHHNRHRAPTPTRTSLGAPLTDAADVNAPLPLSHPRRQHRRAQRHRHHPGLHAHLTGLVPLSRLLALGADVPAFGGPALPKIHPTNRAAGPTRVDLSVHRLWGATPLWTNNLTTDTPAPAHRNSPAVTKHKRRYR